MNEFANILQELISDTDKNISLEDIEENTEEPNKNIEDFNIEIFEKFKVSDEDLDFLTKYEDFNSYLKELKKENRITKKQALEAFAMLPPMIKVFVNKNKYTEASTISNFELFNEDLTNIKDNNKTLTSIYDKVISFSSFFRNFKESNNDCSISYNTVLSYFSLIESDLKELEYKIKQNNFLVVFRNNTYNLLKDNIDDLSYILDTEIDYTPYENKLTLLLKNISSDLSNKNLIKHLSVSVFSSITDIYYKLIGLRERLENVVTNIDKLLSIEIEKFNSEKINILFNSYVKELYNLLNVYKEVNSLHTNVKNLIEIL